MEQSPNALNESVGTLPAALQPKVATEPNRAGLEASAMVKGSTNTRFMMSVRPQVAFITSGFTASLLYWGHIDFLLRR